MLLPDEGSDVFRIGIRVMKGLQISDPGAVWQRVQEIVDKFCGSSANSFTRSSALWLEQPLKKGDLKDFEVIAYLVPTTTESLIKQAYPALYMTDPPTANTLGLTAVQGSDGNLSEIYAAHSFLKNEPARIGECIVHELMHNKLNLGTPMHSLAPFQGAAGGFLQENAPTLSPLELARRGKLEPSGTDIRTMAPVLAKTMLQWVR